MPVAVIRSAGDEDTPIRQQSCRVLVACGRHAARFVEGTTLWIVDLGAGVYLRTTATGNQHAAIGKQCCRMGDACNVHRICCAKLQSGGIEDFGARDAAPRAISAAAASGYEDVSITQRRRLRTPALRNHVPDHCELARSRIVQLCVVSNSVSDPSAGDQHLTRAQQHRYMSDARDLHFTRCRKLTGCGIKELCRSIEV